MSLSRKRKKELRRLQNDANRLWGEQQQLVGQAADIAREAGRQLGKINREQVVPAVHDSYERHVAPVVDRTTRFGRQVIDDKVVPAVGGVVGTAMHVWDVANQRRRGVPAVVVPQKSGPSVGAVIAIVLGAVAAIGVLAAAWQTLRADDELWVADDPLADPEA